MKRLISIFAVCAALLLPACSGGTSSGKEDPSRETPDPVELSLWTYPVGGWGNKGRVSNLVAGFQKEHPEIRLSVLSVDYNTGDAEVEEAIAQGKTPDLIFEGPERLVANWAARGLMAPLNDLWEEESAQSIFENVREACHDGAGDYYVYPLCMTTHCMAINRDLFEAAGAWQYIDEARHTWTTEGFRSAVEAIVGYYEANGIEQDVAAVYCEGQGGDQGTRALVTNLFGGRFTDKEHTVYTVESEENIKALQFLRDTEGIRFDPTLVGSTEIEAFCNGELAMSFCWNVSIELQQTMNNVNLDFDVFPMAFPTPEGKTPELQGGIWGFGIFDNGNAARLSAAKSFIRYMNEEANYSRAVYASAYWPVRTNDLYVNDRLMIEYGTFRQYLGDYYQVTPGWAEARTAWWKLLQKVGAGGDIAAAVGEFSAEVNG